MICDLPIAYPDELLYSLCARYSERMQYPSARGVIRDLFGSEEIIVTVGFPGYLGNLVSNLSPGHHYTVDNMIDNHTLLPFYAPFLPSDRLNQIRQKLEVGKGRAISLQIGLGGDISPLRWLRFCSHCVADDRQRFEECYWHRIHQLPGIDLCPIHNMNLLNSHARMQDTRARYEFLAAEKIVSNQELSMVEPSNRYREMLLKISQEASWLLQNHDFSAVSAFSIRERYLALLADRSLATHGGKIYASKLLQAFKHYYPIDLLKYLHCDLNASSE